MRFVTRTIVIFAGLVFSACATGDQVTSLTAEQRASYGAIQFFMSGETTEEYSSRPVIATITGVSCKRNLYTDPSSSIDVALRDLRVKAAKYQASAIINIACDGQRGTDWKRNCFDSTVCVGDVVR